MKKLLTTILLLLLVMTGCVKEKEEYETRSYMLDVVFGDLIPTVTVIDKKEIFENNPNLNDELSAITNDLDAYYSPSIPTSKVSELNSKAGKEAVTVNDEFIAILKEALSVSELSTVDGKALYDITIAPVVNLWDINNKRFSKTGIPMDIPKDEDIKALLDLVDYHNIIINEDNKTVFLSEVGMSIDLGSIVKGYAANKIRDFLQEKGITRAVINVAGNIITMGYNHYKGEDKEWKINVQTPYESYGETNTFGYFLKTDATAVTSGSYERFILSEDGKEYHHILDPRTGYPSDSDLLSISIITTDSMVADALSTATFCLGFQRGYELVENLPGIEAIFVTTDKEVYVSTGLKDNFVFNEAVEKIGYVYKGVKENGTTN